jgi:four helix bundle protein
MEQEIKNRTKKIAIDVINFCKDLPNSFEFSAIKNQVVRSATSIGANYRASCRARSKAEFISKLGIVEEEADETLYWLELIVGLDKKHRNTVTPLYKEVNEILSIIIASRKIKNQKLTLRQVQRPIKNQKSKIKNQNARNQNHRPKRLSTRQSYFIRCKHRRSPRRIYLPYRKNRNRKKLIAPNTIRRHSCERRRS